MSMAYLDNNLAVSECQMCTANAVYMTVAFHSCIYYRVSACLIDTASRVHSFTRFVREGNVWWRYPATAVGLL